MSDDFDLRLRKELQALSEAVPVNGPQATMPHDRSTLASDLPIVARVRGRHDASLGLGAAIVALAVVVVAGLAFWSGRNVAPASSPTAASSSTPGQTAPVSPTPGPTASKAPGCLVGEVWDYYAEQRLQDWDQPALEQQIDAAGDTYDWVDGKGSVEEQVAQIDKFVADGAKVIVVRSVAGLDGPDASAMSSAIDRATAAGVAVIAYDHVVDSPHVLLVSFDPVEIGRMEARAMLAARPKGNYVIIKGNPEGQAEPDLIASGIHEVLQPAIDRGDIKIVAETYTENWDPSLAQQEMASILSKNDNRIDAVIAESNGMASGVVAALKEVGLDGKVAVAGAGGDDDQWNFNHVAAGTQTVDVWTDARLLGKAAGDAAVALCANTDISMLSGTSQLSLPGRGQVTSILVTPQAITQDNLDVVIDSGWVKQADVCAGIEPGKTSACP
jgi:D-xylose transport system substrate-binding protein